MNVWKLVLSAIQQISKSGPPSCNYILQKQKHDCFWGTILPLLYSSFLQELLLFGERSVFDIWLPCWLMQLSLLASNKNEVFLPENHRMKMSFPPLHETWKRQSMLVWCCVVVPLEEHWKRSSSSFSDDSMVIFCVRRPIPKNRRLKLRFLFSSVWLSRLSGFVIVHCFLRNAGDKHFTWT